MSMPPWITFHPDVTAEHLGLIPGMLDDEDPDPARKQFDKNYQYGGGWRPFEGFKMLKDGSLKYPGDPAARPLAAAAFQHGAHHRRPGGLGRRDRRHHRVPQGEGTMTHREYRYARETLGWTHLEMAEALGVSRRCTYRYQNGESIPEPVGRLLRLLVMMRLTTSHRKFEQIVRQLD